jgi:hypothetical protein
MIDRHPALIAQRTDISDVVASALRFARENDLPVSVRGSRPLFDNEESTMRRIQFQTAVFMQLRNNT